MTITPIKYGRITLFFRQSCGRVFPNVRPWQSFSRIIDNILDLSFSPTLVLHLPSYLVTDPPLITLIMHQPLAFAHEERVGGGDGQIVHHLGVAAQEQALDDAPGAVGGADSVAERQVLRRHPAALVGEEGVLVGGLDRLRIDLEIDQHGVGADQQRRDRGAAGGLVGLVVGQHRSARLQRWADQGRLTMRISPFRQACRWRTPSIFH